MMSNSDMAAWLDEAEAAEERAAFASKVTAKTRGPAHPIAHVLVTYADGSQEEWHTQEGCHAYLRKGVNRTTKPDRTWDYLEIRLNAPPGAILTPSASEQTTDTGDG